MPRFTDGWNRRPPLYGADGAVHLDAETAVDLRQALIVQPGDPEHDHALGLDDPLEDLRGPVLRMALEDEVEALGDLFDGLVELRLGRVLRLDLSHELIDVGGHEGSSCLGGVRGCSVSSGVRQAADPNIRLSGGHGEMGECGVFFRVFWG
jgi:hypothetical protein